MSSMASPTPEMSNLGVLPQTKQILREMGSRTAGNAKSFAKIGALFSLYECVVETHRARHDIVNTLAAGCMTGATLSLKAGPKAALAGCAGFAAFSGAVEYFMQDRH